MSLAAWGRMGDIVEKAMQIDSDHRKELSEIGVRIPETSRGSEVQT